MKTIGPLPPSSFQTLPGAQTSRSGQAPLQTQPGQLVQAQVLESRGASTYLLQIGNQQLLARSDSPLQIGQGLQLRLLSVSPQIELQLATDPLQQLTNRSLALVGKQIDISALFGLLQQQPSLLGSLSDSSQKAFTSFFQLQHTLPAENGPEIVKQLADQIGLAFERLLADRQSGRAATTLKAALLELLATSRPGSDIQDTASKAVSTLEVFQLAQLHADSNQQFIVPLPFAFLKQGFLVIDHYDDKQSSAEKDTAHLPSFSLFLTMSEIGNLRIDFSQANEGLFIRFHTDSVEKANFIASFRPELESAIGSSRLVGLSFLADAIEPAAELLRLIVPAGTSVVDTTA